VFIPFCSQTANSANDSEFAEVISLNKRFGDRHGETSFPLMLYHVFILGVKKMCDALRIQLNFVLNCFVSFFGLNNVVCVPSIFIVALVVTALFVAMVHIVIRFLMRLFVFNVYDFVVYGVFLLKLCWFMG